MVVRRPSVVGGCSLPTYAALAGGRTVMAELAERKSVAATRPGSVPKSGWRRTRQDRASRWHRFSPGRRQRSVGCPRSRRLAERRPNRPFGHRPRECQALGGKSAPPPVPWPTFRTTNHVKHIRQGETGGRTDQLTASRDFEDRIRFDVPGHPLQQGIQNHVGIQENLHHPCFFIRSSSRIRFTSASSGGLSVLAKPINCPIA